MNRINLKRRSILQITANILMPIFSWYKNREVMTLPPELQQDINRFRIDGFARKYFNTHKKGIFRKKVPVEKMLLYQKVMCQKKKGVDNWVGKERRFIN